MISGIFALSSQFDQEANQMLPENHALDLPENKNLNDLINQIICFLNFGMFGKFSNL